MPIASLLDQLSTDLCVGLYQVLSGGLPLCVVHAGLNTPADVPLMFFGRGESCNKSLSV